MTIPTFPNGEPVTVLRAGEKTDPYSGEPVEDWKNPTETVYHRCAVGHGPSDESYLVGRNPLDIALVVYMPYDADVTASDRMEVRGTVFDVYGAPFQWRSPFTGEEAGTEVYLRVREG